MTIKKRRSRATAAASSVAMPPPGGVFDTAGAVKTYLQENVALLRPQVAKTEMAHLFRFGVTAWAAAGYRAEALKQVDFVLADGDGKPFKKLDKQQTALQQSLRWRWPSLIERSEISYCYYGEVLWQRLYNSVTGEPVGYQWVNNNFFQLDTHAWQGLRGFRVQPTWGNDLDRNLTYIPVEESVYMHNMDFFDDFGGVGPVQVAYVQAALETEIGATQLQFFRNMAMPNFALQPAAGVGYNMSIDDKNTLTELMRRMYQGAANAGRTVVLPTRWEMIRFQQDFDKLGMPQLTAEAKSAIVEAMRVPLELLDPRQVSSRGLGAKFYESRREWLLSWLMPQAERYATEFTEQIAQPINPEWTIVPQYERMIGLREDAASLTETITKQITNMTLDLYTAQELEGLDPDPALKGLYSVGGVPVPADQMQDYWRASPGTPGIVQGNHGDVQGGELPKPDKPNRKVGNKLKPLPLPDGSTPNKKSEPIPFLSDAVHRELKSWRFLVERKGADYPFEGKALALDTVAYGRLVLALDGDAQKSFETVRIMASRDFGDTERTYRAGLYNAMIDGFNGSLSRKQFGVVGRDEISVAFLNAFKNGLEEGGVDPDEMTDEERDALKDETKAERGYWTALADEFYGEVMPLKGTLGFDVAKERMLSRIDLWVNKGLEKVHNIAVMYARQNSMVRFVMNGTKNHCLTCSTADGQVHRARTFMKYNVFPRSDSCLCTGINCKCYLEDTTDRASGDLRSVPLRDATKSDDENDRVYSDESVDAEAVAV